MADAKKIILDYLLDNIDKFVPQLSVNCVVFRYCEKKLEIAVVRPIDQDFWLIPGGYIHQDESIEQAVQRVLFEHMQIPDLLLSQFGTYGDTERHFMAELSELSTGELPDSLIRWLSQRFITICYYTVLGEGPWDIQPSPLYDRIEWREAKEISDLGLDHAELANEGRTALASDLTSKPLLTRFMPGEFTLPELQGLYEAILDRPIDRGNFRQRILKSDILVKTGQVKKETGSRPPLLYRINKDVYLNSLTNTVKLGF